MKNSATKWFENNLEVRLYVQKSVTGVLCNFEPFLYQTPKYINTLYDDEYYSFYLFKNGQDKAAACVHFVKNIHADFSSPAHAPFGGIQCEENCTEQELHFLLSSAEIRIREQNANSILIKTAPLCYPSGSENIAIKAYELTNYRIISKHINHHLNITTLPFCQSIIHSEKRRLLKCRNAGFEAGIYKSPDIEIVYNFIKESRDKKGYSLSLTMDQLHTLLDSYPEKYIVFAITDHRKIIALSLAVRVHTKVLYSFLPADLSTYQSYSPMVLLNEAMYDYCQKEGIDMLDLGISLDHHGNEKPGLIRFKKNLGGQESLKITYRKLLN